MSPRRAARTSPAARPARPAKPAKLSPEVLRLLYDQSLLAAGAPPSTPEYLFARDIKRRWRIDRAWPEQRLAVEIEGGIHMRGRHLRPAGFVADMEKYNELALRGWLLIRVTYDHIQSREATALTLRALAFLAAHPPR